MSGCNRESSVRRAVRADGVNLDTGEIEPSRAKQSMKDQCDINFIMARYLKSGNVDHLAKYGGSYGVADALTFHAAMNIVAAAEQMFADLPSAVRKRFSNEPGQFLDFVQNPANVAEMCELGLAKRVDPPPAEIAAEPLEDAPQARRRAPPRGGRGAQPPAADEDATQSGT